MSRVTNLIFTFCISENEKEIIKLVNSYNHYGFTMSLVSADYLYEKGTKWYGGSKFLESPLYIGAFNYLELDPFVAYLRTIKWEFPEEVQLIVKEQNDERFRIINLFERNHSL